MSVCPYSIHDRAFPKALPALFYPSATLTKFLFFYWSQAWKLVPDSARMHHFKDFTPKKFQGACPRTRLAVRVSGVCASGVTGLQHRQRTFEKSPRSIFFLGKALHNIIYVSQSFDWQYTSILKASIASIVVEVKNCELYSALCSKVPLHTIFWWLLQVCLG